MGDHQFGLPIKELTVQEDDGSNGHFYLIHDVGGHKYGHGIAILKGGSHPEVEEMSSLYDVEVASHPDH